MIYLFKNINKVVWGVTPPSLFVTSIEARQTLPESNIEHMYIQVHSSPSREFVRFEKVFFLHFPGNVDQGIAAGCSKTTKDGVSLQSGPVRRLFQRCAANTSSRCVSKIRNTFWHEEKSSFLKHDAIPTIFPASGEVEEGTWKICLIQVLFQLWGHAFSLRQASLSCVGTACNSLCLDWRHEQRRVGLFSNL